MICSVDTPVAGGHVDSYAQQWWDLAAQQRLCVQRCGACKRAQHPPGPICRSCQRPGYLEWAEHDRRGRLVSMTQVMQTTYPAYTDLVPYWIGLVDLGEDLYTLALLICDADIAPMVGVSGEIGFTRVGDTPVLTFDPESDDG